MKRIIGQTIHSFSQSHPSYAICKSFITYLSNPWDVEALQITSGNKSNLDDFDKLTKAVAKMVEQAYDKAASTSPSHAYSK